MLGFRERVTLASPLFVGLGTLEMNSRQFLAVQSHRCSLVAAKQEETAGRLCGSRSG